MASRKKGLMADSKWLRDGRVRLGLGLLALIVLAELLSYWSPAVESFVITTLINLMIVVGLYVLIGNSGVVSFGQISFMALGAYLTGLLTVEATRKEFLLPDLPGWIASIHMGTVPALILVTLGVGLIAALMGIPLMRLSGLSASIATLSLLIISNVVITQSSSITGGNQTFIGVPVTTTTEVALMGAIFAILVAIWFGRSRTGLRLKASRDDEPAARAAGVSVTRERVAAFALSGALIGLAGGLYAHFVGSFSPADFYFEITFITLAMLVVGGLYSLEGAVVGALLLSVVQEVLGRLENGEGLGPIHATLHDGVTSIVLACIVIAVMIFRPAGLMGGRGAVGEEPDEQVEPPPAPGSSSDDPAPVA